MSEHFVVASVLIGIPSYHRPEGLRKLLRSLEQQQNVDRLDVTVFVADNDRQSAEAFEVCAQIAPSFRWPLTCDVVEERGISAARNALLDRAREVGADCLAMIDDDETADPRWLRELLDAWNRYGVDVIGGPVPSVFEAEVSSSIAGSAQFGARKYSEGPVSSLDATGNVLLSCRMLERLHWPKFDLQFGLTGGEDAEYFRRIRARGATFGWASQAVAFETVPVSRSNWRWLIQRAYRVGNCDLRVTGLHDGSAAYLTSLSRALALIVAAPILSPLLLSERHRMWLITKWARSAGKLTAAFGHRYKEYSAPVYRGSEDA